MTVISVTQLNRYVATLLETDPNLQYVSVQGEISSFKHYPSGHMYFNLKDDKASVSCVMFKSNNISLNFKPEDGMKVIVEGRASLYDRDGKFQLYVSAMKLQGIGDLFAAFEQLKAKLAEEGMFDESVKKKIPFLPKKIGVATSSAGAVIQDIINVLSRRFPGFYLQLIPVKVQGEGAAAEIINALNIFNRRREVDVIIIGRGGGSMEDLWCFNDENLARAIFNSDIPVISAVGHETDFTISDFVADLRAPTPSAAAELVVPDKNELLAKINKLRNIINVNLERKLDYSRLRLENVISRPVFMNPGLITENRRDALRKRLNELCESMDKIIVRKSNDFKQILVKLEALSPLSLIGMGYCIVEDKKSSKRITGITSLAPGEHVILNFSDGKASAEILEVLPGGG